MNVRKLLGFAAVAGLFAIAAPGGGAEAASLINPGIAATIQDNAAITTEVRWRRHHRYHRHHGHHRHMHRHWRRW